MDEPRKKKLTVWRKLQRDNGQCPACKGMFEVSEVVTVVGADRGPRALGARAG
jgi:hypothetical protein